MPPTDPEVEKALDAVNTMLQEVETALGKGGVIYRSFKYVAQYLIHLHGRVRKQEREIEALKEELTQVKFGVDL